MKSEDTNKKLLKQLAANQGMNRRAFIGRASGFGLTAGMASTLWTQARASTPKTGGHMKAALAGGATTDTLNPATFNDTVMISITFAIRDNLTEVAPDNTISGTLAESWESNTEATVWTFNLRKGVQFSNGKMLAPQDVINSINLHRGEDSSSGASGVVAGITNIEAKGESAVVFTLNSGNADFPFTLADYHLNIMPAKDDGVDWESGTGTGAYNLKEFEPGVSAMLELNPNRWQQNVGFAETVEIVVVNDANARQTALITGDAHVMNKVDLKTINLFERDENINILNIPGRSHHVMEMNTLAAPFDNPDVREALKYGINREEWVQKVLKGYGTIGNDHPIGPAFRYHNPEIEQRQYDPDKAMYHVKKAGLDRLTIDLSTSDGLYPGAVDGAVLYQSQAERGAIDINVVREPYDGYWTNVWMVKPWLMGIWGPRPTEDLILSIAYLSSAKWNGTHYKNEQLDQLIIGARAELDEAKRFQMYTDVAEIVKDNSGALIPSFPNMVAAVRSKVGIGETVGGSPWELDGGYWAKRWSVN